MMLFLFLVSIPTSWAGPVVEEPAPRTIPNIISRSTSITLDQGRLKRLETTFSTSTMAAYQAIVLQAPAQATAIKRLLAQTDESLGGLSLQVYDSAMTLVNAEGPVTRGVEDAIALFSTYKIFLSGLENDPSLPDPIRHKSARIRSRYLDDGSVLNGMLWERELHDKIEAARRELSRNGFNDEQASTSSSEVPWVVKPSPRQMTSLKPRTRYFDVRKKGNQRLHESLSRIERAKARLELAKTSGWSGKRVDPLKMDLLRSQEETASLSRQLEANARYLAHVTYRMGFSLMADESGPLYTPVSKGLILTRVGDHFAIEAVFATAIADPEVLSAVKDAIETRWSGSFGSDNRRCTVTTTVRFTPPDSDETSLTLWDNGAKSTGGQRDGIRLARQFDAATVAHEFGHVLGLPDEYKDELEPATLQERLTSIPGNLMSSMTGRVLPRHFAEAVRILQSRSKPIDGPAPGTTNSP